MKVLTGRRKKYFPPSTSLYVILLELQTSIELISKACVLMPYKFLKKTHALILYNIDNKICEKCKTIRYKLRENTQIKINLSQKNIVCIR